MPSDSEPTTQQLRPVPAEHDVALASAQRLAALREGAINRLKAELAKAENQGPAKGVGVAEAAAARPTDAPAPEAVVARAEAAQTDVAVLRAELAARDAALADVEARLQSQTATLDELQRTLAQREVALASAQRVAELRSAAAQRLQAELARLRDRPATTNETALAEANQRAAGAERRLQKALTERAQADAALARAQMEAALRDAAAGKAEAETAALREELAEKDAFIARISGAKRFGEPAAAASEPHPSRIENPSERAAAGGGSEGLVGFGDGKPAG